MLIFAAFAIFQGLTYLDSMHVAGFVGIVYCTWAIGQFFDKKKTANYVKAFFAYAPGMITFSLSALVIGTLIDLAIKH